MRMAAVELFLTRLLVTLEDTGSLYQQFISSGAAELLDEIFSLLG